MNRREFAALMLAPVVAAVGLGRRRKPRLAQSRHGWSAPLPGDGQWVGVMSSDWEGIRWHWLREYAE